MREKRKKKKKKRKKTPLKLTLPFECTKSVDVDCGLRARQGARERKKESQCERACARANECMYMSSCLSLFHSHVTSDTTETKVTGRSLPYAQETYKP